MNKNTLDVLDSIFNSDTGYDAVERKALDESPSYSDICSFAELLANESNEELIQKFIFEHPKFLLALNGFGDSQVLAFISKPKIGQRYCADYGILSSGQGGCVVNLIELEPSKENLFTKKLGPATRYQGAITQITDWNQWIKANKDTFINELIHTAKNLEVFLKKTNRGFRTKNPSTLNKSWEQFGGFTEPNFVFTIIIGRWSQLSENEQKRLISLNQTNWYQTYTYEQLIRRGVERPIGRW